MSEVRVIYNLKKSTQPIKRRGELWPRRTKHVKQQFLWPYINKCVGSISARLYSGMLLQIVYLKLN